MLPIRQSPIRLYLPLLALLPAVAAADYKADIGYTKLQQELGALTPDGTGIRITQVEGSTQANGQAAWFPDLANAEFVGKTISNASAAPAGLYSGHATSVGGSFYGHMRSIAPGVSNIMAFSANDWMGGGALLTVVGSGGSRPLSSTSRVANHSYVGSATATNFHSTYDSKYDRGVASNIRRLNHLEIRGEIEPRSDRGVVVHLDALYVAQIDSRAE